MSGTQKVRIAARLRPKLQGEIDDGGIEIVHGANGSNGAGNTTGNASTSMGNISSMSGGGNTGVGTGGSYVSVRNVRDQRECFKFQ
jgi:kinesin family member 22